MPHISIQMLEGRTEAQKRELVEKMTEIMVETTGARKEVISIVIDEVKKENYALAGKLISDK